MPYINIEHCTISAIDSWQSLKIVFRITLIRKGISLHLLSISFRGMYELKTVALLHYLSIALYLYLNHINTLISMAVHVALRTLE